MGRGEGELFTWGHLGGVVCWMERCEHLPTERLGIS
jgi:hypothetical protein